MNLYEVVIVTLDGAHIYLVLTENNNDALNTVKNNKDELRYPYGGNIEKEEVNIIITMPDYKIKAENYMITTTGVIIMEYFMERCY